jgi:hypothetical protein
MSKSNRTIKKQVKMGKQEQFEEAAKPLLKYLSENHHPHTTVIVTSSSAELVESEMVFNTDEFLTD